MKTLLSILLIALFGNLYGQTEWNLWYFGNGAGVDFNANPPQSLSFSNLFSIEGCASIADPQGNLLFYTNGESVWDRTHNFMPNGISLGGHNSSTQSALIVPHPGNTNLYYIFTTFYRNNSNPNIPLNVSLVDMSLGANGDVDTTFLLANNMTEKLTAIPKSDSSGYWVISHQDNNATFAIWEVGPSGLNTTAQTQSVGYSHAGAQKEFGMLKFSKDGRFLASVSRIDNEVEILGFDADNAQITAGYTLQLNDLAYGVEFSYSGQYLYATSGSNSDNPSTRSGRLEQFDLSLPTPQDIQNSRFVIDSVFGEAWGDLRLAPDCQIYIARRDQAFLGTIGQPEAPGPNVNFIRNGFSLGNTISQLGLPQYFPLQTGFPSAGQDTFLCLNTIGQLQATGGLAYTWTTNPALSCTNCPDPIISSTFSEWFYVAIETAQGCTYLDSVFVEVVDTCQFVHLEEQITSQIKMGPLPLQDHLSIQSENPFPQSAVLELIDIQGRVLHREKLLGKEVEIHLNPNIGPGIYQLRIVSEGVNLLRQKCLKL